MDKYCYFNGKIILEDKAHIGMHDMGVLRGYGVFTFLRTYNGKPFFLKEHFNRLKRSAEELRLKVPVSYREIGPIIKKLLKKNKFLESNIRIVLTGGQSKSGMDYDYNSPTFFVLIEKLHKYPASIYKNGARLIVHEYQRKFPRSKTTDYIMAMKLQGIRKKQKAIEILYVSDGFILEAATSNFFIFKKDKLITPKDNVLTGITRNFVISLAKSKFKVEEKNIAFKELKSATEAFITATNKEIIPVVKIGDQKIGNGKVGPGTKLLMELFKKRTQNY